MAENIESGYGVSSGDEEPAATTPLLGRGPVTLKWLKLDQRDFLNKRTVAGICGLLAIAMLTICGVNLAYLSEELQEVPKASMKASLVAIDDQGVHIRVSGNVLMDFDSAVHGRIRQGVAKVAANVIKRVVVEADAVDMVLVPDDPGKFCELHQLEQNS
jgi:hypothetical protein